MRLQTWIRRVWGGRCCGCGAALRVGAPSARCLTCESLLEPCGVWLAAPWGAPTTAGPPCGVAETPSGAGGELHEPFAVLTAWRYGGPVADAITAAKFRGAPFDVDAWADSLATGLRLRQRPGDALVPIPPDPRRLRTRGRHLPDELAQWLARRAGLAVGRDLLRRVDRSAPRALGRVAPPVFTAGSPRAVRRPPVGGRVWLVDDVVTTGTTLRVASASLGESGLHVQGAVCLADARLG